MNISKKVRVVILTTFLAISISACSNTSKDTNTKDPVVETSTEKVEPTTEATTEATTEQVPTEAKWIEPNKPLFTDIFFADPSAHVFDGKLYIYPSHDIESGIAPDNNGSQYAMEDYHVLSIDDFNSACVDNGEALHVDDVP